MTTFSNLNEYLAVENKAFVKLELELSFYKF